MSGRVFTRRLAITDSMMLVAADVLRYCEVAKASY